jgi:hypothetical protein
MLEYYLLGKLTKRLPKELRRIKIRAKDAKIKKSMTNGLVM